MKKLLSVLFVFIFVFSLLIVSCQESSVVTHQVVFRNSDGSIYASFEVNDGDTVPMPIEPIKNNYTFLGWFKNEERYDFSLPITQNTSIYAKFKLNAESIANEVSKTIMKSMVTVYVESYDVFWGLDFWVTDSTSGQGSGFCFDQSNNTYYILTNCHVARKDDGFDRIKITIIDYKGNKYEGKLLGNAISAEYDLACIYFSASETEVTPIKIAKENPKTGDDIIAIGSPHNQTNSITFGNVINYTTIQLNNTLKEDSNVTFHVIAHTAGRGGGSSGGAVLNSDLKVVGVHYAGSTGTSKGYAIPIEKVWEFLDTYVYK